MSQGIKRNSKWRTKSPASTQMWQQYSIHGHMVDLQRYKANSGERNFIEQLKAPIFLEAVLAIGIMQVNLSILKDDFCSRTDPSIFTSIEPLLLDWSNKTSWVFPALKSTSHFLPQSTVSCRSDSSSEANSCCYHRSDAWSHLEYRAAAWAQTAILHMTLSGRSSMYSRKSVGPRMEHWGTPALTGLEISQKQSFCYHVISFVNKRW